MLIKCKRPRIFGIYLGVLYCVCVCVCSAVYKNSLCLFGGSSMRPCSLHDCPRGHENRVTLTFFSNVSPCVSFENEPECLHGRIGCNRTLPFDICFASGPLLTDFFVKKGKIIWATKQLFGHNPWYNWLGELRDGCLGWFFWEWQMEAIMALFCHFWAYTVQGQSVGTPYAGVLGEGQGLPPGDRWTGEFFDCEAVPGNSASLPAGSLYVAIMVLQIYLPSSLMIRSSFTS